MDVNGISRQEPRKYKVRVGGPCFPAGAPQPCPWQGGVQALQVSCLPLELCGACPQRTRKEAIAPSTNFFAWLTLLAALGIFLVESGLAHALTHSNNRAQAQGLPQPPEWGARKQRGERGRPAGAGLTNSLSGLALDGAEAPAKEVPEPHGFGAPGSAAPAVPVLGALEQR